MSKVFRQHLVAFNRKERFLLLQHAIGAQRFTLGDIFRASLSDAFQIDVPADAYFAVDYHLDWLYAAAFLASWEADVGILEPSQKFPMPAESGLLTATQEDIDLLIAFPSLSRPTGTDILLLEAKGVTAWTNRQLRSKVRRLSAIFGQDGNHWTEKGVDLVPRFGIVSPVKPKLMCEEYPQWVLEHFKKLYLRLSV